MKRTTVSQYVHRLNKDRSYDSICLTCFATATSTISEEALIQGENDHTCSQYTLYRLSIMPHGAVPNA
jgi:hypothetical protein